MLDGVFKTPGPVDREVGVFWKTASLARLPAAKLVVTLTAPWLQMATAVGTVSLPDDVSIE
jgi:hypothetical protein